MRNVSHYESPVIFDEQYFRSNILSIVLENFNVFFSASTWTIPRMPTIRKRKTFQSPRRNPLLSGKVPLDTTFRHYSALVAEMFFNLFNLSSSRETPKNIDSFAEPLSNNHQTWLNTGEFPVGKKKEKKKKTHSRRRPLQLVWPPAGIDFDFLGPKVHKQQCIDFLPAAFWLNFALQAFLIRSGFAFSFFFVLLLFTAPTLISHQLFSFLMRFFSGSFTGKSVCFYCFYALIHVVVVSLALCEGLVSLCSPLCTELSLMSKQSRFPAGFRLRHNHWKVTKIDPDFRFHPDADDGANKHKTLLEALWTCGGLVSVA